MLKQPLPSMRRRMLGSACAVALLSVTGYAAWAAQPVQPAKSTIPDGKIAPNMALRAAKPLPVQASATSGQSTPIAAQQATSTVPGNFNTYERMLTSLSDSWMPPQPQPQDDC